MLVLFLEIIIHSKTIIENADIIRNIHDINIDTIHVDNIHCLFMRYFFPNISSFFLLR